MKNLPPFSLRIQQFSRKLLSATFEGSTARSDFTFHVCLTQISSPSCIRQLSFPMKHGTSRDKIKRLLWIPSPYTNFLQASVSRPVESKCEPGATCFSFHVEKLYIPICANSCWFLLLFRAVSFLSCFSSSRRHGFSPPRDAVVRRKRR